ncbi:MAG: energy-coupling factor ABC transporter permease [Methanomassiliicoccus sp.]|nr:energy-coupling factor ABC transporter permease [Methanomassiliicoccus sp.]
MAPEVWITGWVIALIGLGIMFWKLGRKLDERTMPMMAILAAGIFVAQMLNFPIGGGTTGHLIGAALATILLGPYAAMLIITAILTIQCLVFGDGGVTALGLNILNMAIIAPLVTYGVMLAFGENRKVVSTPVAAWTSVFVASTVCAAQLALSYSLTGGAYGIPGTLAFPAMMGYHAVIGIGEAAVTTGVVLFLAKVSPEMLKLNSKATGA